MGIMPNFFFCLNSRGGEGSDKVPLVPSEHGPVLTKYYKKYLFKIQYSQKSLLNY